MYVQRFRLPDEDDVTDGLAISVNGRQTIRQSRLSDATLRVGRTEAIKPASYPTRDQGAFASSLSGWMQLEAQSCASPVTQGTAGGGRVVDSVVSEAESGAIPATRRDAARNPSCSSPRVQINHVKSDDCSCVPG